MSGAVLASAEVSRRLIEDGDTRQTFWHFPGWLEAFWYVLAVASVVVFLYGIAKPLAKYLSGHRGGWTPRAELPGRFRAALRLVASQATVRRRDRYAGVAHAAMFYGFVTLFVGTVVLAINTDVTERLFGWRFFTGDFYKIYSVVLDVMGIALLAGVLAMMVRRAVLKPRKLDYARPDRAAGEPQYDRRRYRWGDWVFVGGLLYLVVTGYVVEGVRIAMDHPADNGYSPAGWLVSRLFTGVDHGTLEVLRMGLWWAHGLVALTLVSAIPYTKATHMLTSFASLVLRDEKAGKRLKPIAEADAERPAGYGVLADFSPTHLLQLDACTKCGKCHEACPANATGKPLSPRDVILELREEANAAFAPTGVGGVLGTLLAARSGEPMGTDPLCGVEVVGEQRVKPETVWSCMQCNACVEACPVGIEQAPIINQLRRRMVEDGELPAELQTTLRTIQKSGNSFGENKRRRGKWTAELDFEVPDARKQAVDVLWFVGDYASFDPRSQKVTQAIARLYHAAGVDFGILYDSERNAGNDVRRVGEEGLWEALAEENIANLNELEFNRIVTSDPHSLNTLRNEYPDLGGTWPISHHTTFLLELLDAGRLDLRRSLDYRVTYHDPCYLGRHNGEYDAPRRILEHLGCELVEMPRNRDNSFCCGAGGGRIWIRDEPGAERPSENRIREATSLGELDYFVVSCPKDVTMFEDAIKTTNNSDSLALRELTELLEEALTPAPAALSPA
ncbi:MAG TPA: (Fe-S)-binding protein [Baekduia sp.]|uniref:(Fe-S)-binding protein n=1 Tax=Baekduia sp. TaxID=2600305 RepID=UPI002D79D5A0|nr:(Fe-S)-binding protein [Baekduia sp.]HET6506988.1 (Fe-S)-binding protein [Baekduia sp.]